MSGNLTFEQIAAQIEPGAWDVVEGKLAATFQFKDFAESMAFVNKVADVAANQNHHPYIEIDYNKVKLILWTHTENGITEKDVTLANIINKI